MAKGSVEPVLVDPQSHFAHAVVTNQNEFQFDVVSLRLSPPVFRMDFWGQRFWNDHNRTRKNHRNQLQQIMDHLKLNARTKHVIIGGDFNLVGGDGALSALTQSKTKRMKDTFHTAGVGWCNTGTSEYPLFRVDQIWTNQNFSALSNQTIATKRSDHRMVIADIAAVD